MFIGHFAVGFAAKAVAPRVSLGALMAAPLLLDLLWPLFLAAGLETVTIDPGNTVFTPLDLHDYPYTHSLLMAIVWSLLFGGGYFAVRREKVGALVIAAGVFSHWLLDFVTHRPDMPLYPGSGVYVGLGLWNSRPATMLVETAMFAAGVWIYARTTRPRDSRGRWTLWTLIGLLSVLYLAAALGPPPPDVGTIIVAGFSSWVFVLWARWIDNHREVRANV